MKHSKYIIRIYQLSLLAARIEVLQYGFVNDVSDLAINNQTL